MRSRIIKPGYFKNEILAEQPEAARLLFAGLWMLADRDGRLEDRPKRIKAELFPYKDYDCDSLLLSLHNAGFILRYGSETDEMERYIEIPNFNEHQSIHKNEKSFNLPPSSNYPTSAVITGRSAEITDSYTSYSTSTSNYTSTSGGQESSNYSTKGKPKKEKFLEFVFLTDDEVEKLKGILGGEVMREYIERLNNYIGSKGKQYRSHYYVIRAWARRDYPILFIDEIKSTLTPEQEEIFSQVQDRMRSGVTEDDFEHWLSPLSLIAIEGQAVALCVPNTYYKDYLDIHYLKSLTEAFSALLEHEVEIEITAQEDTEVAK